MEEVGERGIRSHPGCKCAEIHPPLVSKRQITVPCWLSCTLSLLKGWFGAWWCAGSEHGLQQRWRWRKKTASWRWRNERNFVLSESKVTSQQQGKNIQYWILMKEHTGTSFNTSSLANTSWGTPPLLGKDALQTVFFRELRSPCPQHSAYPWGRCCPREEPAWLLAERTVSNFDSNKLTGEGAAGKRQGR